MKPTPVSVQAYYKNICLYSDPGVGKTVLLGTSPNALILNADGGTTSAAIQGSDAEETPCTTHGELTEALEYFEEGPGCDEYEWLWLDSGTLFQDQGLSDIMKDVVAKKPHRNLFVPDKPEYLMNMNRLMMFIRTMHKLPINFGITAHSFFSYYDTADEEEGKDMLLMPLFQGKNMPQKICGYMNIIGRMVPVTKDSKGKKLSGYHTRLIAVHSGKAYGKDHFGAIGRMMDPTIPKIEAAISERIPNRKKPARRKGTTSNSPRKKTPRKRTRGRR
jgi:hypothetical protein